MFNIYNYINGYVIIKLVGANCERILNKCMIDRIQVWDISTIDKFAFQGKISRKGFKKLRKIIRKNADCKVFIVKKCGLPVLLRKIVYRKALILGLLIFLITIFYFSSFLWVIEIKGIELLDETDIRNELRTLGLKEGISKFDINKNEICEQLIINNPKISWVGINYKGTKAIVRVSEKVLPPELKQDKYKNIIASDSAIIEEIKVFKGKTNFKIGDKVNKGDILIIGKIEEEDKDTYYVAAEGAVKGITKKVKIMEIPVVKTEKEKTGRSISKVFINIKDRSLNIINPKLNFDNYEVNIKTKSIPTWRNIEFPVEIIIEEYNEIIVKKNFLGIEGAFEKGKKKIIDEVNHSLDDESVIADKFFEKYYNKENGKVIVEGTIEVVKDIGEEQLITFDN